MKAALAIFVKTPGRSPVKTRLASTIGAKRAQEFHLLSAKAVEALVKAAFGHMPELKAYWAVAEADVEAEALGDSVWSGLETIGQGPGGLGDRLSLVYGTLLKKYETVMLMGADSPQLDPLILVQAYELLKSGTPFVIGPAEDGGFYLFGGSRPLEREVWTSVTYSSSATAEMLRERVSCFGKVLELPIHFDVDTVAGLKDLKAELSVRSDLLPEQRNLLEWVKKVLS